MEPPPPPAGDGDWDKALRNLMKNKDLMKTAPKGREGVDGREGLDNELDATPASDEQFDSELRKLLRDSQANLTASSNEAFMPGKETDEPLPEVVDPSFDWYAEWRTFQKDHAAPDSDADAGAADPPAAVPVARSELAAVTFGSDSDSEAASVVPPAMELASVVPGGAPYAQKPKSAKAAVAKASPLSAALAVAVALFSRFSGLFRAVLSWLAGRFGVAVATKSTHPEMDPAANAALSSAANKAKRGNKLRAPDDINAAWKDFSKRQQKNRDEPTDD